MPATSAAGRPAGGKVGLPHVAEMAVTLVQTQIAAGELADLRVGDVIATETAVGTPAVISIDGETRKLHAQPGVYRGRKAVRIIDPTESPAPTEQRESPESAGPS